MWGTESRWPPGSLLWFWGRSLAGSWGRSAHCLDGQSGPAGPASLCWLLSSSPLTSRLPGRAVGKAERHQGGAGPGWALAGRKPVGQARLGGSHRCGGSGLRTECHSALCPSPCRLPQAGLADPLPTPVSEPGGGEAGRTCHLRASAPTASGVSSTDSRKYFRRAHSPTPSANIC